MYGVVKNQQSQSMATDPTVAASNGTVPIRNHSACIPTPTAKPAKKPTIDAAQNRGHCQSRLPNST